MTATITKNDAGHKKNMKALINALRACRKQDDAGILSRLARRIKQGTLLNKLKDEVEHGEWLPALRESEYDIRTAERLMNLPGTAIDQIRTSDPNLAIKLPDDLQKLVDLAELSLDQLREALAVDGWNTDDWSRKQVAEVVNNVLKGVLPLTSKDAGDAKAVIDAKNPKQHRDMPQQVAHEQPQRAGNHQAHETDVAVGNVGEEAADSHLVDAIDEAAKELYDQVIQTAQEWVQGSKFKELSEQGYQEDELTQAIFRRLCALLTGPQGWAAD